ncbi:hypothetical protein ACFQV8_29550 [Pseudonocardia benzenivorans]
MSAMLPGGSVPIIRCRSVETAAGASAPGSSTPARPLATVARTVYACPPAV